jgi:hypothetical protein
MTKQAATEKGLSNMYFKYSATYEEKQAEIERLRKLGYKAHMVRTPANPLSRGHHGPSYDIYVDQRYHLEQTLADLNAKKARFPAAREAMEARHAQELQEQENQHNAIHTAWAETVQKLNELKKK